MTREMKDAILAGQASELARLVGRMGLSQQEGLIASQVMDELLGHVHKLSEARLGKTMGSQVVAKAAVAMALMTMQSTEELLIAEKPELARYIR